MKIPVALPRTCYQIDVPLPPDQLYKAVVKATVDAAHELLELVTVGSGPLPHRLASARERRCTWGLEHS